MTHCEGADLPRPRIPPSFMRLIDMPLTSHPNPQNAPEGSLDRWLYYRLSEQDPSWRSELEKDRDMGNLIPITSFEVIGGAVYADAQQGGDFSFRVVQVSIAILSSLDRKIDQQGLEQVDLTTLENLGFLLGYFDFNLLPENTTDALRSNLKQTGSKLLRLDSPVTLQTPPHRVGARLLDSLTLLPASSEDADYWEELWLNQNLRIIWTQSYNGLVQSSLERAVRELPTLVGRFKQGWDCSDVAWALYKAFLEDPEKRRNYGEVIRKEVYKLTVEGELSPEQVGQLLHDFLQFLIIQNATDPAILEDFKTRLLR